MTDARYFEEGYSIRHTIIKTNRRLAKDVLRVCRHLTSRFTHIESTVAAIRVIRPRKANVRREAGRVLRHEADSMVMTSCEVGRVFEGGELLLNWVERPLAFDRGAHGCPPSSRLCGLFEREGDEGDGPCMCFFSVRVGCEGAMGAVGRWGMGKTMRCLCIFIWKAVCKV